MSRTVTMSITLRKNQQGVALVIGLIVLLIMTLMGIASMSGSTAELKMANNLQTQNTAFQAVETAAKMLTDAASADTRIQAIAWSTNDTLVMNNIANVPVATGTVDVDARLVYAGCTTTPEGYELGTGMESGGGSFKGLVHDVDVTATMLAATNTPVGQSRVVVGVQTVRPGCPDVVSSPTVVEQ